MEWTASVPVTATTHVSAPKPPNDPKRSNGEDGDVPMREATEETKQKKQPAAHNSKKQSKDKDKSVHWGENVVHEMGTTRTTVNRAKNSRSRNRRWFGDRK